MYPGGRRISCRPSSTYAFRDDTIFYKLVRLSATDSGQTGEVRSRLPCLGELLSAYELFVLKYTDCNANATSTFKSRRDGEPPV